MQLQFPTVFANTIDPYIPEVWANESLMILQDNLIAANLVKRDFQPMVARMGDTVNTRAISTFVANRKVNSDNVTDQDAVATNVPVVLNQHIHVSFVLKDGEMSMSFKDLVSEFLRPALIAEGKLLDQVVIGQSANFLGKAVGGLGTMTKTNVSDYIVDAFTKANTQKIPEDGRSMIWTPSAYGLGLKNSLFVQANTSGDGGNALANADLGRKFGFSNYLSTLAAEVGTGTNTQVTGAINNAAGYAAATTALTVDGFSAAITSGSFISINGIPYRVASTTGGATPTVITIQSPGLQYAVADNDVVTVITPGAVNLSGGYAAGYTKTIALDGFGSNKLPVVGQPIAFGTATDTYTIVRVTALSATACTILLDRALDAAIADNDIAAVGPVGTYSFGFHRDAIALVCRPLAPVPTGAGAQCAVVNWNGLSVRVTMTYDGLAQGLRITVDFLCGVKTLNTDLGVVMLG